MRRRSVFAVLAVITLLVLAVACGGIGREAEEPAQRDDAVSPGDFIDYEGPQTPKDTEWLLRSLDGDDAAEGSDITLTHGEEDINVEGGCMGFYIVHELEEDRIRVVKPGLQVGRLDCDNPEEVQRQAESILGVMRNLDQVRATRDRFELRSESGGVAAFVPPAPARVDPELVGTEWLLTSLGGEEPLPKTEITLEIDEESAGGSMGCNSYGGGVKKMSEGSIVWSGTPDVTTVGCPEDERRQEAGYLNLLDETEAYRIEDGQMGMMNGEGGTTLVFEQEAQWRSDPAKLVGTSWVLRSTDGQEPQEGSVPTVRFESEKEISWYDGCQNFEGRYFVTENDLTVPSFGVVDRDCIKPGVYGEPDERCVIGCFGPEGDYRLRDGVLEIRSEAGETTSILEPMGEEPSQKGTPWELRAFAEGDELTPVRGAGVTLTFDRGTLREEGTVFGSTGCNDYSAAYEYPRPHNTFERITVAAPVTTRRACPGPPYLAEQEQRFLAVLGDLGEYPNISPGGELTLETRDGRSLIFAAPE